jgi:hypothetical protein
MNWHLVHSGVAVTSDSGIVSKSHIVLESDGNRFEIGKLDDAEVHILGAKRVLVDTANMLKRLAHEMENKADRLK